MQGIVKWYSTTKGYGFITKEGGGDIFIHQNAIQESGVTGLRKGQKVEFETTSGPKGEQAVNLKVVGETEESTNAMLRALRKDSREILRDLKKRRDRR